MDRRMVHVGVCGCAVHFSLEKERQNALSENLFFRICFESKQLIDKVIDLIVSTSVRKEAASGY